MTFVARAYVRTSHALAAILLLTTALSVSAERALATGCGGIGHVCDRPSVHGDKYIYDWDGNALRRSLSTSGYTESDAATRLAYEYRMSPACIGNGPPGPEGTSGRDLSCLGATANPACLPGEFAMFTYRRLIGPAAAVAADPAATEWAQRPITCLRPSQTWDLADLTAIAGEHLEDRVSRPVAVVEPATGALVQLPVIVHTTQAPDVGFDVTQPFPGRLEASASYVWDFGEGDVLEGVGTAYDGTSPTRSPRHYLAHTYVSSGAHEVTLEMTWSATFTVAGFTIPLTDIVFTDTAAVQVRSAHSELVAGT